MNIKSADYIINFILTQEVYFIWYFMALKEFYYRAAPPICLSVYHSETEFAMRTSVFHRSQYHGTLCDSRPFDNVASCTCTYSIKINNTNMAAVIIVR